MVLSKDKTNPNVDAGIHQTGNGLPPTDRRGHRNPPGGDGLDDPAVQTYRRRECLSGGKAEFESWNKDQPCGLRRSASLRVPCHPNEGRDPSLPLPSSAYEKSQRDRGLKYDNTRG